MGKLVRDILQNKYGKYTISKVVPFFWFIYLLLALTFKFDAKSDIPKCYYELTLVFSGVYVGRTALDKMKDFTQTQSTPPPTPPQ
jgi:hypothetical protein